MSPNLLKAPAEGLLEELQKRRKEAISKERKTYPQHAPRASNIHECARNIAYQVLDWDKAKPWDDWMLERFAQGRREEKAVIEELKADGFEIIDRDVNGQLTIAVPEQTTEEFRRGELLTGAIDGLIKWNDRWLPYEVKSMAPYIFNRINTVEDFKKSALHRKYLRQLACYCYGKNVEQGLFILTDTQGHRKYLILDLDYAEAEWILQHLEKAVRAIKKHEYPERIPYRSELCDKCQFVDTCLPDQVHLGMEIMDSQELEATLDRRAELEPLAKEFEAIDEEVKETLKGVGKDALIGHYSVFLKRGERTTYDIPEELKLAHSKKVPTVTVKIVANKQVPATSVLEADVTEAEAKQINEMWTVLVGCQRIKMPEESTKRRDIMVSWVKAFPKKNLVAEISKADAWLVSKDKYKKDYPKFLFNWFSAGDK